MFISGTEVQSKSKAQGVLIDGGLPLYPQVNQVLTRNPETLRYANEAYSRNSIVFNCITRRAQALHQAPLIVKDLKGEPQPDCYFQKLLNNPNVYMDSSDFWQTASIFTDVGGTTFVHKVRDSYGVVNEIYPYHASQINYIQGTDRWIDGYVYDNGAGYRQILPVEDVGRIKFSSVNFFYTYRADSPLLALLKEVNIDNQRGELETALLVNGGVPSFAMYPGDVNPMTQDQMSGAMEGVMTRINGRNRGRPLLMNSGYKIEKLGYSPKDMMLTEFSLIPETRICAVYGVPVGLAQMLTGLKYAGTFANRESDKQLFFGETMVTAWIQYARNITRMFKDETFYDGKGSDYTVEFDYLKLPSLMESNEKLQGRIVDQWRFNLLKRDRALVLLGEVPIGGEEGEEYFSDSTGGAESMVPIVGAVAQDIDTAPKVEPAEPEDE